MTSTSVDPGDSGPLTTRSVPYGEEELPLVEVACYLCGSRDGKTILDDPPFRVVRCGSCSFAYVTPRVPDSHLHLIYQTQYFKSHNAGDFGYSDYTKDREGYLKTFRRKAKMVSRFKSSGRVLEVGSAAGFFLHAMKESGFEVEGVEVSKYVCEFAANELGIDSVFNGRLEDAPLEGKTFDVVAMWDVIEHLADPIAELKRIRGFMKPDGILVMQTQNVDAFFAKLLGSKWQHFKQLEHVYHFSPTTLRQALDRAGYETVSVTNRGAGKYISVEFFVDRMRRYSKILHHLLYPARLFGRRFFYLNPHDEIIVVAKPKD
ncbi:MAG: class I SAM-dependent methyltransferase [Planctomycetes bacterium]|nr:class I SAM-dependent methyltransferase [Planctomycetota bacterium]